MVGARGEERGGAYLEKASSRNFSHRDSSAAPAASAAGVVMAVGGMRMRGARWKGGRGGERGSGGGGDGGVRDSLDDAPLGHGAWNSEDRSLDQ